MPERGRAYLDWNATAPIRPEAVAAMVEAVALPGNPSSLHREGRAARALLEAARRKLAERLAVAPDRVVFTSGGTEANHLALLGFPGPRLVSAVEHPSILAADPEAATVPVDVHGRLDLAAFARLLAARRPKIAALMLANNETGTVQPVAEAARLAHAAGCLLHVDAVQGFGKLPFTLPELGVDLLAVSAHKIGAPPGIGALVIREGLDPAPLQRGGGQERRRRAGTENLPGIAGFAAVLELTADWPRVRTLRDRLEAGVRAIRPDVVVAGEEADRLPNTACLLTPGLDAATQLMALDLAGIAVSSGAACSSGKIAPSHALAAMGIPGTLARTAIRVSLGWSTTDAEIDLFLAAYAALPHRPGSTGA
jgi:cysteine desulfurase